MPKKQPDTKTDHLRPVEETEEEREVLKSYYPNLNPNVEPREWTEPPWGHKEERHAARSRTGRRS